MLPDTVHKLPQSERFAYAKLLAHITRIDNELTVEEMSMFEQRLGTALLSPKQREMIRFALKNPPPLEECLQDLGQEAGRLALRDAVLMAASDGTVDEDDIFNILNLDNFSVDNPIDIEIIHKDGSKNLIKTNHSYNDQQIEWYKEGSALNLIKKQNSV